MDTSVNTEHGTVSPWLRNQLFSRADRMDAGILEFPTEELLIRDGNGNTPVHILFKRIADTLIGTHIRDILHTQNKFGTEPLDDLKWVIKNYIDKDSLPSNWAVKNDDYVDIRKYIEENTDADDLKKSIESMIRYKDIVVDTDTGGDPVFGFLGIQDGQLGIFTYNAEQVRTFWDLHITL